MEGRQAREVAPRPISAFWDNRQADSAWEWGGEHPAVEERADWSHGPVEQSRANTISSPPINNTYISQVQHKTGAAAIDFHMHFEKGQSRS